MKNIIKPVQKSKFKTEPEINSEIKKTNNKLIKSNNSIVITSLDLINLFINYKIPVCKETIDKICEQINYIIKK